MPTKPLDRLMFVQGGHCFFCRQKLPKDEASVEHLLARANGGGNSEDNCVACCKSVNALFGSMSLKEKFQVVLNQQGKFVCPNRAGVVAKTTTKTLGKVSDKGAVPAPGSKVVAPLPPRIPAVVSVPVDRVDFVLRNLKQRGNAKPRKLKTLKSCVSSLYPKGLSADEFTGLLQQILATGKVAVDGDLVSYAW